jgi:predicted molibdopterin-dependent oxidoreductase YjgC
MTTPEMLEAAFRGELEMLWSMGGDFREVMPAPELTESSLRTVPLRVHQDIVLSAQMLIDPADTVVLLPATTRYEIQGGVTETSTERRVIFSPEIPGPRIGEARSEWEVFLEIARRVRPEWSDKLSFPGTRAIREEIARAIPMYEGIQNLTKQGDNFQYGGSMLCAGWKFSTADGKARFKAVTLPQVAVPAGFFRVVTRRGKQFNSMVQEDRDPNNAAQRDAVLISPEDAKRLGLGPDERVTLKNGFGTYHGRVLLAPVRAGTLEIYWPEGNVLVDPKARSPLAKIPAYKEISATLERVRQTAQEPPRLRV